MLCNECAISLWNIEMHFKHWEASISACKMTFILEHLEAFRFYKLCMLSLSVNYNLFLNLLRGLPCLHLWMTWVLWILAMIQNRLGDLLMFINLKRLHWFCRSHIHLCIFYWSSQSKDKQYIQQCKYAPKKLSHDLDLI